MKTILFALFNSNQLANNILTHLSWELGDILIRSFPDEESYVQIRSEVKNKEVVFLAPLDRPNAKIPPLLFAAQTAKALGATKVGLIAPYLPYMRQDQQFNPGESLSAHYFSRLISPYFDWLITIDPHLHRYHSLAQIYSIPTHVLHAIKPLVAWIKMHIQQPVIIGPDKESEQWVKQVATYLQAPYVILEKKRKGDRQVEILIPKLNDYQQFTPVLVDDIISSAATMIETIQHLKQFALKSPVCIGVHAIFAEEAYQNLLKAGAEKVVSCNTINHPSNQIEIAGLVAEFLKNVEVF